MKNIYFLILLIPFLGYTQDLQIVSGGPWMLDKIVIENIEYFPGEVLVEHIFNENQSILSHWNCFETHTSGIDYTETSSFILSFESSSGSTCEVPIEIYQKHFEFSSASEIWK